MPSRPCDDTSLPFAIGDAENVARHSDVEMGEFLAMQVAERQATRGCSIGFSGPAQNRAAETHYAD
jgi:hypothetical protein